MKIHFVCTGNTFRSRIAEAYLRSKNIDGVHVSSSGTEADKNLNGPVCSYTVTILKNHNLDQYLSKTWRLTKKSVLETQDLVIFLNKYNKDYSLSKLNSKIPRYETWDVDDIPAAILRDGDMLAINQKAEQDYYQIKELVDVLVESRLL
ncbi:MAG: hypothetical protein ABIP74_00080 [Candidatus Saccharimonas sp.]